METTIRQINSVLKQYFARNPHSSPVAVKAFMDQFIQAGIFDNDHKNGLPIRTLLRKLQSTNNLSAIPYVVAIKKSTNTNWFFAPSNKQPTQLIPSARAAKIKMESIATKAIKVENKGKRSESDEHYILNLCDTVLKSKCSRQHTFDFLVGDPGKSGACRKLPVDGYYLNHNLVVEYHEIQHAKDVPFFNKRMTVSGIGRQEQRKLYDGRKRTVLISKGIKLITFSYSDFSCDRTNRLLRNKSMDIARIRDVLKEFVS